MTREQFNEVWTRAIENPDINDFIREQGTMNDDLYQLHALAHMDMKELVRMVGTQNDFATTFCIPVKTVNGWCSKRPCPSYVRMMICRLLGLFDEMD